MPIHLGKKYELWWFAEGNRLAEHNFTPKISCYIEGNKYLLGNVIDALFESYLKAKVNRCRWSQKGCGFGSMINGPI